MKKAKKEMAKDGLSMIDAVNVVRAGVVEEPESENGSWRYRVRTERILVVVAFGGEDDEAPSEIVVVTAWKEKGR